LIKSRLKVVLVLMVMSLLLCSFGTSCAPGQDFDKHLRAITRPYWFSIVKWELNALGEELSKAFGDGQRKTDDGIREVTGYFSGVEQIRRLEAEIEAIKAGNRQGDLASLEAELSQLQQQNKAVVDTVEKLLETRIREALSQQGIFNPINKYTGFKFGFPPVNFKLGRLPHLLVVSPRDRIESMREVVLLPDMSLEDMESIEDRIDKLGVSSLVVELGGLSTYPSFVTDMGDLPFILNAAIEEWLHQYLAFKPLGFRYVLDLTGIRRNYEIATMNETLAGIVSKEIGAIIYESYYAQNGTGNTEPEAAKSGFDFNQEMREIRRAVDNYLAKGEIEQAEEFMEQKRQYLTTKGYHIRKLNQAYFAFYGAYGDMPHSISPIGVEMKKLRSQSASLKDFLETVAAMTSRQDLADAVSGIN
jgi:hypothetical protein